MKLTLIIPTKNRVSSLKKTILSIRKNLKYFNQIIIVDSSNNLNYQKNCLLKKKIKKKITFLRSKPSISLQRNIGIKNIKKNNKYYMFLDDDISFKKNSIPHMINFLKKNKENYVGYGFNICDNSKLNILEIIKNSYFINLLGFYSSKKGDVLNSGWQTKLKNLKNNKIVKWLPAACVIYKKINRKILFDQYFKGYSYLEDLDFSYRYSKYGKLIVCAKAKVYHPNDIDHSSYLFGQKEILNRYHFVIKNNLSVLNFYKMAISRSLITILSLKKSNLLRFLGNIKAFSKLMLLRK